VNSQREYDLFLKEKLQWNHGDGFRADDLPEWLYGFQSFLTGWALQKGRALIAADCGLGKTAMQLAWGDAIVRRTNNPVLLLTPIAVGPQTIAEAAKFGIDAVRSRDGTFDGSSKIVVTNYEQLHKFDSSMFAGVIADESSGIKDAKSERKAIVTEFLRKVQYRLLCTATAAPNDFWELGTSSEALGLLGFRDMITTFFKQETSKDHHGWGRTKYRFRGHAEHPFWSWVCSWARSMRMPSDLGFSDDGFILPGVDQREYVVDTAKKRDGYLMALPGGNLNEQRAERRNSIPERCEKAAEIVEDHKGCSVVWCELNEEGEMLRKLIPNSVEVKGSMSDDEKEEALVGFSTGQIDRLIIKPKIGAWGLNWQHCHNTVHLPSHSYEQFYQAFHRFNRFGQKEIVKCSLIVNEGERGVLQSIRRKAAQTDQMFASIVQHMKDEMHVASRDVLFTKKEVLPTWL
jgi:hypothetical protein